MVYYESKYGILYKGDCLDVIGNCIKAQTELVLTDIPYGEVNRQSNGLRTLDKKDADIETFNLTIFLNEVIQKFYGSSYIFCGIEQVSFIKKFMREKELSTRLGIWEKTNPSPMNGQSIWLSSVECCVFSKKKKATFNEHCKSSVWRNPIGRSKQHPTEKPIALFERLVKASSQIGSYVLDPCIGSGTTAVAAINTGRKFIGIERNEEYCEIAKQRIIEAEKKQEDLFGDI